MERRTSGILATLALLASGLVALSTSLAPRAGAVVEPVIPSCATDVGPCLMSLKRDGLDVDPNGYRVVWQEQDPVHGFYSWFFEKFTGSSWTTDLGSAERTHAFSAALDFGSFNPRTVGAQGAPAADPGESAVQWGGTATDHEITISGYPAFQVLGCHYPDPSGPAVCPTTGEDLSAGLSMVVNDASWNGTTEEDHARLAGFYNFRNTEIGEAMPSIVTDPATGSQTLVFELQNSHEDAEHVVFQGFQYLRLSNAIMSGIYGVPDPRSMTPSSLSAVVAGGTSGTLHVIPESDHAAMLVDITGVTFSARTVKVRLGTIVPTAPTHLVGKRLSRTKVKVDFAPAKARGARPTGYVTRCVWHHSVKTVRTTYSVATVGHLRPGKKYTCRARANSRAGYGPWSASIRT